MKDIMMTLIYCVVAVGLMQVGIFLVDFIIPCNFKEEIEKGNKTVGYISAGTSIGIGIILKSAIMETTISTGNPTLIQMVASTVVYYMIGIGCLLLGYRCLELFNRKYQLNQEIRKGNVAAGLMVLGLFIGLALAISGIIY